VEEAARIPAGAWRRREEALLVQRVVEKITGVPIATYMKKNVLEPLGMTSSTYAWSPALEAKAASGHDRRARPLERSTVYYEKQNYDLLQKAGLQPESASYTEIVSAYEKAKAVAIPVAMSPNMAGSLWTTANDYPKFITRVLAESTVSDPSTAVAEGVRIMRALGSDLGVPVLLHGEEGGAWPVLEYAMGLNIDTRIGFVAISISNDGQSLAYKWKVAKFKAALARDGAYLLRSNQSVLPQAIKSSDFTGQGAERSNLHIAIVGRHYGLGPLSVGHPNRHTAVVVVPRRTKPNPHHAWGLAVRSRFQGHGGTCASPCIDRVPAVGWLRVPP
jgi:CubicO group peptidase (beta-lactamase class C family)